MQVFDYVTLRYDLRLFICFVWLSVSGTGGRSNGRYSGK